jgi:hypothetical protein
MNPTESNRKRILDMIEHITTGRLLAGFDTYYADDVVMSENGEDDPKRHGKANNRGYEQFFVENAQFHDVKVGPVLADGDHTSYEMYMDLTFMGNRMQRTQWAVQEWKNGKIARETFYYKG